MSPRSINERTRRTDTPSRCAASRVVIAATASVYHYGSANGIDVVRASRMSGRGRPLRLGGVRPAIKQIRDGAGAAPAVLGLFGELGELRGDVPLGAVDGRGGSSLLDSRGIGSHVEPQLPGVAASFAE